MVSPRTDSSPLSACAASEHPQTAHWHRWTLWLIAGLLAFRLAYLFLVPLDLVHDEAYYWDWSRQLDWGYYSKPPMVAWLIALSTQLAGSTAPVVRLPAVLLGTVGLYLIYLFGARLYDPKVGFFAALLCAMTPGNAALSLLMTIDVPLLFFWMITLYALWRAMEHQPDRPLWLVLATAACGLGLLSKQTMIAALAGAYLFVVVSPRDRRELLRPGLHLWAVGSLAFLIPVLWWNAQHGWITLEHTGHHFEMTSTPWLRRLLRSGEFVLGQLGLMSPVTGFLTLATMAAGCVGFLRLARRERFLLCFSAVPLSAVFALSLLQRVEPNWPAVFYPAGLVLLVAWGLNRIQLPLRLPTARALPRAVVTGVVCTVLVYCIPFVMRGLDLQQARLDPTIRLRGWHELGAAVSAQLAQVPRPSRTFMVVTDGRATASELAFYMAGQPRVFLWNRAGRVMSQYDIWGGPRGRAGWDAVIVTPPDERVPSPLTAAFRHVQPGQQVHVPISGERAHTYQIWHATGFTEWPADGQPALPSRIARSRRIRR